MDIVDLTDAPVDADSGVRLLGASLPYADGAEDSLLELMRTTPDRSAGSDELAAAITDWPSRYHLSVQRRNLVAPLQVRPGMRVLDVGAGTGAVTRHLGEQGAEVLALEGSLDRARVAAARCRDLDNVTIASGALADLPEATFDLVLCVGVLEYALAESGGGHQTADDFVAKLASHVADHGTVAVAIENQLGLKYLLGYPEDHLGRPWEGIEGYQGRPGVRTYSRRALGRLLADGGLPTQQWLYPFPDYKLPETVLHESVYAQPDTPTLVDQLVPTPVREFNNRRTLLCDDRGGHRTFLDAGLGAEVANSFLVLASPGDDPAPVVASDVLAWHYGHPRRRRWRRTKLLVTDGDRRRVETVAPAPAEERACDWLRQEIDDTQPFVAGRTLQQQVLDACAQEDLAAVGAVLQRWAGLVDDEVRHVDAPPDSKHPFVSDRTGRVLTGAWLDCNLDNFLEDDRGAITFFDREWQADGPVDADLVRLRALWYLARVLVTSGAVLPWPDETTVDELTTELWHLALPDVELDASLFATLCEAEAHFQHLVTGRELAVERRSADRKGDAARAASSVPVELPFTRLRARARQTRAFERERNAAQKQVRDLAQHLTTLQAQVRALLRSRRWRIGRRVGDAYARVLPGRAVPDEEANLTGVLDEGDRLLARVRGGGGPRRGPRASGE